MDLMTFAAKIKRLQDETAQHLETTGDEGNRREMQGYLRAMEQVGDLIKLARDAVRGSRSVQMTLLEEGSLARVTPCATISASQRIGAPSASACLPASAKSGEKTKCRAASTTPQAWIMRTAMSASEGENRERSASARIMAKDRS